MKFEIIRFKEIKSYKKSIWIENFKAKIAKNQEELAFIDFTFAYLKNSNLFKTKAYTMIGEALALPIIFLFIFKNMKSIHSSLFLGFYFITFFCGATAIFLKYSENKEASWILKTIPNIDTANIFRGSLKAFTLKIVLPCIIIGFISMLIVCGLNLYILLNAIIFFIISLGITPILFKNEIGQTIPFSQASQTLTFVNFKRYNSMFLLIIIGTLQILSYLFLGYYGLLIFIGLSIIFSIYTWKNAYRIKQRNKGDVQYVQK